MALKCSSNHWTFEAKKFESSFTIAVREVQDIGGLINL